MADDFRALHTEPERRDPAWRYGIGPEILDSMRCTTEIGNWLRKRRRFSLTTSQTGATLFQAR